MRYKELPSSEGRQQRDQLPVKMLLTLGWGGAVSSRRRRAGCGAVGGGGVGGGFQEETTTTEALVL